MSQKRGKSFVKLPVEHAKEIAMIFGIAVMTALFLGLLVDAVYESPEWDEFCEGGDRFGPRPAPLEKPSETCSFETTEAERACYSDKGDARFTYDEDSCRVFDYCDMCGTEYRNANEVYNRNVFFIITPIGILFIILGIFWSIEFMGTGFMFGGIFSIFYSTARYFGDMSKLLRVIVIGIYLLILLLLGYVRLVKKTPLRAILNDRFGLGKSGKSRKKR